MKFIKRKWPLFLCLGLVSVLARAQEEDEDYEEGEDEPVAMIHERATRPIDCSEMEVWDVGTAMCMPLPMEGMPMTHLMIHGNGFVTGIEQNGPRGRDGVAAPHMLMVDLGTTLGDLQYLNLDLMLTGELWTTPKRGYPLFMQIGEEDKSGNPYVDSQHPHSSPIMGLTISDTIKIGAGERDHVKLFFAPRGAATEGPIPFMHRLTGMANPDAPLGHHVGQDVAHISSTVFGASARRGSQVFELSVYSSSEPEPTKVNLPLSKPDSIAGRYILEPNDDDMVMFSVAHLQNSHNLDEDPQIRISASFYQQTSIWQGWEIYHSFIYGAVTNFDEVSMMNSFGNELLLKRGAMSPWLRIEVLQRTAAELQIVSPLTSAHKARWVGALTWGYTHDLWNDEGFDLAVGASATVNFIPQAFQSTYGRLPWAGRIFLQLGGMGMWSF